MALRPHGRFRADFPARSLPRHIGGNFKKYKTTTEAGYFAYEKALGIRREVVSGIVEPVLPEAETHAIITGNMFAELRMAARARGFTVFQADMPITGAGWTFNVDASAVRGKPAVAGERHNTLTKPGVLVEVFSEEPMPWTTMTSAAIAKWPPSANTSSSPSSLASPDIEIPLSAIYSRIEFQTPGYTIGAVIPRGGD